MPSTTPASIYVPPPSIGHELGVLFGFVGLMALCMVSYGIIWQIGNKRSQKREAERVEELRKAGYLDPTANQGLGGEKRAKDQREVAQS